MGELEEKIKWRIALRAFEIYELGGCKDGRDLENWIQAEAEILGQMEAEARAAGEAETIREAEKDASDGGAEAVREAQQAVKSTRQRDIKSTRMTAIDG